MARPAASAEWLTDDGLLRLESFARDGLNNEQIAAKIGIHVATLYKWQAKHSEFGDALKRGKAPVDFMVENALLKSALGYEVTEVKDVVEEMPNGQMRRRTEKTVKHYAPNATSIIFWLTNRKPDVWKRNGSANLEDNEATGANDWKAAVIEAAAKRLADDGKEAEA